MSEPIPYDRQPWHGCMMLAYQRGDIRPWVCMHVVWAFGTWARGR